MLQAKLYVEQQTGDLGAAVETLNELTRLMPGDVWILDNESLILEKQGHLQRALERAEAAMRRRPSIRRLYRQAVLAKDAGAVSKARESLEQLLALSPEDVRGISLLAQLELTYGDPRRTVEILSPRVARAPATWQLTSLSLAYMLLRDYAASARASEQALALKPETPLYLLNLADARWLDGRRDEALALYRRFLAAAGDPGDDPGKLMLRAQAQAHLGQTHDAVDAAQRALRLAPEDTEVLFNVALVYTVVGDWTTAEVNARRALELGYARRWFELPWFDELRARPTSPWGDRGEQG